MYNFKDKVGVTAPFYLTKLLMPYFAKGASIINISSSRDRMSYHGDNGWKLYGGSIDEK